MGFFGVMCLVWVAFALGFGFGAFWVARPPLDEPRREHDAILQRPASLRLH